MARPPKCHASVLSPSGYAVQPWKNGLGETREIARGEGTPFPWRLSWAKIAESGPFSDFTGYDRTLVILTGGPIALSHDGKAPAIVSALNPHRFRGDVPTVAKVGNAAEDFNAFALRGTAKVNVYPAYFTGKDEMQFPLAGQEHFLFGVDGEVDILEANTDTRYGFGPRETFRLTRPDSTELLNLRARARTSRAVCLWIVVYLANAPKGG